MSIKALQDYTYFSKYARYNPQAKRRETWNEAIDRVMEMHLNRYPQVAEEIEEIRPQLKEKRFLGSQRALQFGGKPIERINARIYNCISSYCDRIRFFQECFWLLLCGCGTGFSAQKHHIAKLPEFYAIRDKGRMRKTFVVPDSIEGWADSLGVLLATYFPHSDFSEWENYEVDFDFRQIRPAGSYLSSGVGKAPGPEPLKQALVRIRSLLQQCVDRKQVKLRPIDAYDICMFASDAVLSGGVRRSATLCLFSPDDDEMARAKTGNWQYENPQRARSNNSALLLRDKTTKEDFFKFIQYVKEFGEPGFIWADDLEALFNPCVEIGMWAYLREIMEDGSEKLTSGWQACNLCEINGKKIKSIEDFRIAAKGAAILGTIQAGYTDFHYLGDVSKKIVERESLLGVSITGMMDSPDIIFNADIQKEMAKLIVETNEEVARKIGINPAARCTCIKPAGTTSCVLGTSSGVHPHHARRYIRHVQGNRLENILQHFKKYNPFAVERCVWSANGTDEVVAFTIEVKDGAKTKNDIGAMELLEHVKSTQAHWVSNGKIKARCSQPWLTHNVSNTIYVMPDEWDKVADYIYRNRKYFAGISLLPQSGDLDYPQAPFVCIHTPREILQMYGDGTLMASGLIVDGLDAFSGDLWVACDAVQGLGTPLVEPKRPGNGHVNIDDYRQWEKSIKKFADKLDWIRRVKQFADRYCEGDVKRCCYLMKEVNNWKKYLDLNREYKDVIYEDLCEEEDFTTPMQESACAGGVCLIG